MINIRQFKDLIIVPTLKHLDLYSDAAANLLLGTAIQESDRFKAIKQYGNGPALGFYQVEPNTHHDIYKNFLVYNHDLETKVKKLTTSNWHTFDEELIGNMYYATAIARLVYYRKKPALPAADDVWGMAGYWKQHYNTPLGKGTVEEFYEKFPHEILGVPRK